MRNWDAECERWHQTAVKKLKQAGRCPFRLRIYTPIGVIDWADQTGLSDEGRLRLQVLNREFRSKGPTAVLFSSDTWQAGDAFWKHYGLQETPYEKRQERYVEILAKEYEGSLANVPDSLKSEAVFTVVKGPQVVQAHRITYYRREGVLLNVDRDLREKIVVIPTPYGQYFHSGLIPDWWESTVN